jgi:bifunctional pyridoxal-dependent enzyme with beta-cystathionase and maltose regulon repressor activities
MANLDNRHNALVIVDRVHHPIVALANAKVILAGEFFMTRRAGSIG